MNVLFHAIKNPPLRWHGILKWTKKIFFNMVKKDQLWAIALKKRNSILKVLLKMVAMETNHFLLR